MTFLRMISYALSKSRYISLHCFQLMVNSRSFAAGSKMSEARCL